jgi:two-component system, LytTR family, sensor kinase
MLAELGGLLRLSLERAQREMVTLREEVEFLELYLAIERTRRGDRLGVRFDVSDAALDFPVPNLILQPLVENAIGERAAGSHLLVTGSVAADARLHLEIRGRGVKTPEGAGDTAPELAATRARLRQRYGDDARLENVSAPGGGTRVVLHLPRQPLP